MCVTTLGSLTGMGAGPMASCRLSALHGAASHGAVSWLEGAVPRGVWRVGVDRQVEERSVIMDEMLHLRE
jgi:hypothetical protein